MTRRRPVATSLLAATVAVCAAVLIGVIAARLDDAPDVWVPVSDDAYALTVDTPHLSGGEPMLVAGAGAGMGAITFLKFRIVTLPGGIAPRRSELRLTRAGGALPPHVELVRVPSNHWAEQSLTGSNAPRLGRVVGTARPDPLDGNVTFDVTREVRDTGDYSFAVTAPAGEGLAQFVAKDAPTGSVGQGQPSLWLSAAGNPMPRTVPPGPDTSRSSGAPQSSSVDSGAGVRAGASGTTSSPDPAVSGVHGASPAPTPAPDSAAAETAPSSGATRSPGPVASVGPVGAGLGGEAPAVQPSVAGPPVVDAPVAPRPAPPAGRPPVPAAAAAPGRTWLTGPPPGLTWPTGPPSGWRWPTGPPLGWTWPTGPPPGVPPVPGVPSPGAPAPASPAPGGTECTAGTKLVPTCGVLWGVAPGGHTTTPRDQALRDFERKTGRTQAIYHAYQRGTTELFPTAEQVALAREPGKQRVLFLNWKPTAVSWARIARGDPETDAFLDRLARHIRSTFTEPFFFTVHHEPEDDVRPGYGSGWTARDYSAMYRHVVERLRRSGVGNLVSVVAYMAYVPWNVTPWFEDLYPGDDVVDWVAWDAYAYSDPGYGHGDFAEMMNRRSVSRPHWPGFYNWAARRFPTKPLMVAEWGVWHSDRNPGHKAYFYDTVGQQIELFPRVKALVYFDTPHNQKGLDSRVDSTAGALTAYQRLGQHRAFRVSLS